ncbi:MAG: MerR family transcriptional regulator [Clostridia bacterium]|nr:MerR family transcriptional regulator [Clostridia bacterium]
MNNEKLTDINEVCRMLGCTSRTLRFYEEKGIIKSTKVLFKNRRQYTNEQINEIKEVLVLRSLGLPIAKIKALKSNNQSLVDAIVEKKAEIIATIRDKSKVYNLLDEAFATLKGGGNIFEHKENTPIISDQRRLDIIESLTKYFLNGFYDWLYDYFSDMLKENLSLSMFKKVVAETLSPIGNFIEIEKITRDESLNNVYYSYLKYEKLGLYIKFVFAKEKLNGIWLNYYHTGRGK